MRQFGIIFFQFCFNPLGKQKYGTPEHPLTYNPLSWPPKCPARILRLFRSHKSNDSHDLGKIQNSPLDSKNLPPIIKGRVMTTTQTSNGDETMEDLNIDSRCFGWNQIAFWMESVHYWSNQLANYGDDDGFYAESIKSAWRMVDRELFGDRLDANG